MIRPAVESDLDQICAMSERFTEETTFPLTYDPSLARETLWGIVHDDHIFLVAHEDGILMGFIIGYVKKDFFCESCAYVRKFFIDKEFRGLGASRELLNAFEDASFELGATMVFAATHAGMGVLAEKLYVNLFSRFGYQITGRAVSKEIR